MSACMIGWAHTCFGKLDEDLESLIARVVTDAMDDAGVCAEQIDAIYLSTHNGGLLRQEFPGSLVLQANPLLRFKPVTRVENACAGGSAAVHLGLQAIAAGAARTVLIVGVEKMSSVVSSRVTEILTAGSYLKEEGGISAGFAGIFGQIAERYFEQYGDQSDALARIAAKNHRNGASNPLAQIQKDLGFDFCRLVSEKNPLVAGPLRRTDCSPISDGAAALVLVNQASAAGYPKAVGFRSAVHINDFLPMSRRNVIAFEGPALAWKRALSAAKIKLSDLSFVETHDCFTIAELLEYEAMGLTPPGHGARAIDEGWVERDGMLPINPSGGLKAKGHPIGATGVSMHVLAAMQLSDTAGATQIPKAQLAGIFNMGGTAVANYVSILERLR
jgi:acetyl-CoA C-acetyltransferase